MRIESRLHQMTNCLFLKPLRFHNKRFPGSIQVFIPILFEVRYRSINICYQDLRHQHSFLPASLLQKLHFPSFLSRTCDLLLKGSRGSEEHFLQAPVQIKSCTSQTTNTSYSDTNWSHASQLRKQFSIDRNPRYQQFHRLSPLACHLCDLLMKGCECGGTNQRRQQYESKAVLHYTNIQSLKHLSVPLLYSDFHLNHVPGRLQWH